MADEMQTFNRRATDRGFLCQLAFRASQFWDWIDKRAIHQHVSSIVIMFGTVILSQWAMGYASSSSRPGLEVAAIIAAVTAPYMALQAAALAFYFKPRS